MTEKLYEEDSYIKEFTAEVVSSTPKGVILNRTAFFPEGGGQQGDSGYINGIRVKDTVIDGGIIYHKTKGEIEVGHCECSIDWDLRFDRMQNHTGEHILSGVIHEKFGYNNVGFHMSLEEVTLDVDGKLSEEDIKELEGRVNEVIDEDLPIKAYYPPASILSELDYRSKLELSDGVRIVDIEGVDKCACCAPHLKSTATVGLVKIIRFYNYKGGTRMHILCGQRARRDYSQLSEMNTVIVNAHSSKRYELCRVVCRLEDEISSLKEELKGIKNGYIEALVNSRPLGEKRYIFVDNNLKGEDIMSLADKAMKKHEGSLIAVFNCSDPASIDFVICGEAAKAKFEGFKARFSAKGGGRDAFRGRVNGDIKEIIGYFEENE